jgi:hypothetical protein
VKRNWLICLLALFCCRGLGAQSSPTELRIHPVDESGNPIAVSRTEIYLDLGTGGEKVALAADSGGIRVPLDREWLCTTQPASCDDEFAAARLVLHAEGYAPVASNSFLWLGSVETPGAAPQTAVQIEFLSGAWMHLAQGESKELTVPFRRPARRTLHFLNQAGEPVAGVGLRYSLLLGSSDSCDSVEGELLAEGSSDQDGEIIVPDADGELDFEFTKAHTVLLHPQYPDQPMRLTGLFSAPLDTVIFRELERRPLHIQITGSGEPSGMVLSACRAACPCGACCGRMAESDAGGRIDLEDFYPEEYDRLTLLDRSGQMVWQSTPRTLVTDPVVIELPKTTPVLSEPLPLERR